MAGAAAGMLCALLLIAWQYGVGAFVREAALLPIGAVIGAACGAVVGPLGVFGFLRRVPVGRLFLETTLGAAVAGAVALHGHASMAQALAVAAGGFCAAGGRLAWVYRHHAAPRDLSSAG